MITPHNITPLVMYRCETGTPRTLEEKNAFGRKSRAKSRGIDSERI